MAFRRKYILIVSVFTSSVIFFGCNNKRVSKQVIFTALEDDRTGLHFENKLTPTEQFNMFNYMYYYDGAGVGAGDFNNDGLTDLFFASNQGQNTLYLNEGNLHFKDVSKEAQIPDDHAWSTGVSIVDINNDGLLDIYVCRIGHFEILKAKNQLLICKGIKNGIPIYKDEAKEYGLDFSGFSTQAVFLDYDLDGDLDMFLLNHTVHHNGSFADRQNFLGTYDSLSGDRLYRNDAGHFTDVTRLSKINSSSIGYGLGVAVSDINLDGWPDIYVGNDFHENDYLYINQKDGTFSEECGQQLMHTSQFSMGVDVADANNDGFPEIFSADMLPYDPVILKRSFGDNDYDVYYQKIAAGYNYQYPRNNLQYNRKNGLFSETGVYSGVYATDWSWAPLWMDFDNDGLKDLFISNGIPKRLNDMDYIHFVYSGDIQEKLNDNELKDKDLALIDKFPEIKIPNKFYRNNGSLKFNDLENVIENNKSGYSNGAVYADLDNDGDLDIVVNDINEPALIYENRTNDKKDKPYAEFKLKGNDENINAIGTKLILFVGDKIRTYEKYPTRGFMSSMEIPMHIGLADTKIDSAFIIWPGNTYQRIEKIITDSLTSLSWRKDLPVFDFNIIRSFGDHKNLPVITDITSDVKINYVHKENPFNEFNREPLMPHMVSSEGPALAVADINHDGLEDVFIGASKTFHNGLYIQKPDGSFFKTAQPDLFRDSMCEDVDAAWVDVNNDGNTDLVIATGGDEYYGEDEHMLPRVYINDGKGNLTKQENSFTGIFVTASCVAPYDFNGDGFTDLFIGGRAVPWEYGKIPRSYLLQNDGTGRFIDVTDHYSKALVYTGMVTGAAWTDLDNDGDKDLIVSCEWGALKAYINNNGSFSEKELTDKKGWWNFILPVDLDNDGDIDLVAGNLGLNDRIHASTEEPVKLYYNDFDNNGKKEQVLTYSVQGKETVFATKSELEKQIPVLKKTFLHAEDFAKASLDQLFSEEKLSSSEILSADYFANVVLINDGNLNFTVKELPWQAQLSTCRTAAIIDANGDDLPDLLIGGNYYDNNVQEGRSDEDFGTSLFNNGNGSFLYKDVPSLHIKGQVRRIREINIRNNKALIFAKNNDSTKIFKITLPGNKGG